MSLHSAVHIVGGAHTPFIGKFHPDFIWKKHPEYGIRENPTLEEHLGQAVREALSSVGAQAADIDRGYVGNFVGELFANQGHLGSLLARADEGFIGKPFMRVEGACASGGLALACGVDAIQAGADLVLVTGVEVQTTYNARDGADFLARAAHYATERELDPFTFPCMFARRTKAYMGAYGLTEEELGQVAVKAYRNGNRNPYAHMRAVTMTLARAACASDKNPNFLQNEAYKEYLKVSDCSQVSDGASAIVLASPEGLRKLGRSSAQTTEIAGLEYGVGALGKVQDLTFFDTTHRAATRLYEKTGANPADLQVVEVHDCFSICELLMTEALGLTERGAGIRLITEGVTTLDGACPVNPGGGLMAFGHPVGATGVKQALEIFRQMHGQCGDYQIDPLPTVGLSANMGGDDRTVVTTLYRKGA